MKHKNPYILVKDIEENLSHQGFVLSEKAREVFAATFAKSIEINKDVYSESYLYGLVWSNSIAIPVFENLGLNVIGLRNMAIKSLRTSPTDDWDEIAGAETFSKNYWFLQHCIRRAKNQKRSVIYSSDIVAALVQVALDVLDEQELVKQDISRIRTSVSSDASESYMFGSFFHMIIDQKNLSLSMLEKEIKKIRYFEPHVENIQYYLSLEGDKYVLSPFNFFNTYNLFHDDNMRDTRIYIANIQRPVKIPLFFREELEELNWLINRTETSEYELQKFFEKYPKFLLGTEYRELHSQVIMTSESGDTLIPDFIVERVGSNYCDILDLKKPNAKLLVGPRNRRGFSKNLTIALNQLREYRNYFENPRNREAFHKKYGLLAYRPKIVVIIGRSRDFHCEIERMTILDEYKNIQVMTYDDILERAKRMSIILK